MIDSTVILALLIGGWIIIKVAEIIWGDKHNDKEDEL